MMKARYLRAATLEELRGSIADNLKLYRDGSFQYLSIDRSKFFEGSFDLDDGALTALLIPDGSNLFEEENCGICYRALASLTPYEARDERLWTYLTHTIMLEYARKRWPIPADEAEAVSHIKTHFFAREKRQIERDNAASRLWWMAHLCTRVPEVSLEDALQVLLYRSDVRANLIERPTVSQSVEVFGAIMSALHASFKTDRSLFEREKFRSLMMGINAIGGVKLLDCMSEPQISSIISDIVGGGPSPP